MEKWEMGMKKKSLIIPYHNGEIWCEHLDALGDKRELLKEKLSKDMIGFDKPSITSSMIIILDETQVGLEVFEYIWKTLSEVKKPIRKLAFTGLDRKSEKWIRKRKQELNCPIKCFNDLEKAKEWISSNLPGI